MSVVFDRPYRFIPPHTGNRWPNFIQTTRLYDLYLRRAEGVVDGEIRGLHHFEGPLRRGDGIILAPNHCRYADPLILGWPARQLKTHLYAMASWHLFNKGPVAEFALRKMGAFSLNREATDRKSLDFAVNTLVHATRPLVLFPEGATYRTNDYLKPLLDGVTFIARTAARKAAKEAAKQSGDPSPRQITILPIGIKYLCLDPVRPWADKQLTNLEKRFGWRPGDASDNLLRRTDRVHRAHLGTIAARFDAPLCGDTAHDQRQNLIRHLLAQSEPALDLTPAAEDGDAEPSHRARAIRTAVVADLFSDAPVHERVDLRRHSNAADAILELAAYPRHYLDPNVATDTRVVETIQRMQESLDGECDSSMRLKSIIRFDDPIAVPTDKPPRGQTDPLRLQLRGRLDAMISELSTEAKRIDS